MSIGIKLIIPTVIIAKTSTSIAIIEEITAITGNVIIALKFQFLNFSVIVIEYKISKKAAQRAALFVLSKLN